jgi:transposase-like protein
MHVQGVSTRKVKAITEELCGHSLVPGLLSRAGVQRVGANHDPEVGSQQTRRWLWSKTSHLDFIKC